MYNEGREWIALYGGQQLIDFEGKWREQQAEAAAVEQDPTDQRVSHDGRAWRAYRPGVLRCHHIVLRVSPSPCR